MPRQTPFVIFIDTAEQLPFTFQGIYGDADTNYDLWDVRTSRVCLGRHPNSLGDYSITDGIGRCHVERKSMADAHSTLLGYADGHRSRFERELDNLGQLESALVIVECTWEEFILNAPQFKSTTSLENAKNLYRSYWSLVREKQVPWHFSGDRASAALDTFTFLRGWWDKWRVAERQRLKELERQRAGEVIDSFVKPF